MASSFIISQRRRNKKGKGGRREGGLCAITLSIDFFVFFLLLLSLTELKQVWVHQRGEGEEDPFSDHLLIQLIQVSSPLFRFSRNRVAADPEQKKKERKAEKGTKSVACRRFSVRNGPRAPAVSFAAVPRKRRRNLRSTFGLCLCTVHILPLATLRNAKGGE